MSHLCAIPDCERPAKDGQLMCWPHWRRVPRALNHAVFDTYRNIRNDSNAYRQARDAAIAAVVTKEQEYDL
jgi:hypothetical protein